MVTVEEMFTMPKLWLKPPFHEIPYHEYVVSAGCGLVPQIPADSELLSLWNDLFGMFLK